MGLSIDSGWGKSVLRHRDRRRPAEPTPLTATVNANPHLAQCPPAITLFECAVAHPKGADLFDLGVAGLKWPNDEISQSETELL